MHQDLHEVSEKQTVKLNSVFSANGTFKIRFS